MPQIELKNLSKSFKADKVLEGISLSAEKGEIVVVFGPSGTGKTVLLRLVAGVEEPDTGEVLLENRDMTQAAPEERGVGMAFQNFALFPHMSAYDNVASALTARHASAETIRSKVDAVAKLLKIGHVMQHQPRELSNGQKQRTALARALVADPHILLLDDPLRNVDAKLRYEMRLELPSLLKASGSTVLYVTQDYKEAMALGDRIAVLLGGSFVQVATPAEVYRGPATLGVARLFGDPTINLIPVEPQKGADGPTVSVDGTVLPLPAAYAHAVGGKAVLGVRPESVEVGEVGGPGRIAVEVVAVTPLNEKTVLLLKTQGGREILASEPGNDEAPRRHGPAFAAFDPAQILLFEAESGRRIQPRSA